MVFLDLQIDEMKEIERTRCIYDFPTVSFYQTPKSYIAYFNKQARKIIDGYVCVKIYANAEYVVFRFFDKNECNSYGIKRNNLGGYYISCSRLKRIMLHGKSYKLYNTGNGYAIKINEPLNRK